MGLSDKPGVLGVVGTLGQQAKQSVVTEIKKTIENTTEQLSGKERKEGVPTPDVAVAEAARQQQSKDVANWLYGTSEPALPEVPNIPKPETKTATFTEQLGVQKDAPHTTATPLEQIGLGKSNQATASITEQLRVTNAPVKTPEEQQKYEQLKSQLHNEYYQNLTTPQAAPDTEERMKEAQEEQETPQQRMERQMQEDLQKKQEEAKKKQLDPGIEMAHNMEKNRGSSG